MTVEGNIFLLWTGTHSDAQVLGAYTDRKNAEDILEFLAARKLDYLQELTDDPTISTLEREKENFRIEPIGLDTNVEAIREGAVAWHCVMNPEGVGHYEMVKDYELYGDHQPLSTYWLVRKPNNYETRLREKGYSVVLAARVYAKDEKTAVKVTNEIRLQLLAHNRFKEGECG